MFAFAIPFEKLRWYLPGNRPMVLSFQRLWGRVITAAGYPGLASLWRVDKVWCYYRQILSGGDVHLVASKFLGGSCFENAADRHSCRKSDVRSEIAEVQSLLAMVIAFLFTTEATEGHRENGNPRLQEVMFEMVS
jgi:hypothetical protein